MLSAKGKSRHHAEKEDDGWVETDSGSRRSEGAGRVQSGSVNCLQTSLLAVILICSFITFYTLIVRYVVVEDDIPKIQLQMIQYEQLVRQTSEMVQTYKTLSGQSHLPAHLTFSLDTSNEAERIPSPWSKVDVKQRKQTKKSPVRSFPSTHRDVIMGLAEDIDPMNMAVFMRSLRNVSQCAVILFVERKVSKITKALAEELKVKLIPIQRNKFAYDPRLARYHASSLRWLVLRDFLFEQDGYKRIFDRAFVLDVRDTYFQRDPFAFFRPDDDVLHVFQGVEDKRIADCSWHSKWITNCFDTRTLYTIGKEHILCSGTVAGSMQRVSQYIEVMGSVLIGDSYISSKFPACESNGVDQGVHNVLVHRQLLFNPSNTRSENPEDEQQPGNIVRIWNQSAGPVANLQARVATVTLTTETSTPTPTFVVHNAEGQVSHVVHQYDRVPHLQQQLISRYVDWANTSSLQSLWTAESTCNDHFAFREDVDIFRGRCDLSSRGGALSAVSCCKLCVEFNKDEEWMDRKDKRCASFVFFQGTCYLKHCQQSSEEFLATKVDERDKVIGAVSALLSTLDPQ